MKIYQLRLSCTEETMWRNVIWQPLNTLGAISKIWFGYLRILTKPNLYKIMYDKFRISGHVSFSEIPQRAYISYRSPTWMEDRIRPSILPRSALPKQQHIDQFYFVLIWSLQYHRIFKKLMDDFTTAKSQKIRCEIACSRICPGLRQ